MQIKYKEPYWLMFNWDLTSHHNNQYVTEFNKIQSDDITNFIYKEKYTITCEFKIPKNSIRDEIGTIFGKSGKNLGLTYNKKTGVLGFEYWTKDDTCDDIFNMVIIPENMEKDVEDGVTITIVKDTNKITLYKNFEKRNEIDFDLEMIDDYRDQAIFFGCSNPGTSVAEHRYYGEFEIDYFSVLTDVADVNISKNIYEMQSDKLIQNTYYKNILCLYDFNLINNIGIVYDESKNSNFLEKVPSEFIL